MYETSQRDLRVKVTELQRISHELDKTREQKDGLARENKKLGGEWDLTAVGFVGFGPGILGHSGFLGFLRYGEGFCGCLWLLHNLNIKKFIHLMHINLPVEIIGFV